VKWIIFPESTVFWFWKPLFFGVLGRHEEQCWQVCANPGLTRVPVLSDGVCCFMSTENVLRQI